MRGFAQLIVVGLIAGWLAGKVWKGGGYGVLIDITLGILGGVVGGWIFGAFGWQGGGLIASLMVAFVGAVILVGFTRLIKKRQHDLSIFAVSDRQMNDGPKASNSTLRVRMPTRPNAETDFPSSDGGLI